MPLKLTLSVQSQSLDATTATIVDSSGIYSASNPTGYGVPNEALASILTSTLTVLLPNVPGVYSPASVLYNNLATVPVPLAPAQSPLIMVMNSVSSPTAQAFAAGASMPLMLPSPLCNLILPNGIYGFTYVVNFADGTFSTVQGNFFLVGAAQIALYSKIGALSLIDPASPVYANENPVSLAYLDLVTKAAVAAYNSGDLAGAQKMAEWLDVRCNTLIGATRIGNYGQASLGSNYNLS